MKKMKKNYFKYTLLISLILQNFLYPQDTGVCMQDLSIFAEYVKVKNYASASEPWLRVRKNCPDLNAAIYTYGERILKDNIRNGTPDIIEASNKD